MVSGFVHWIKLSHIVAYALKTLVRVDRILRIQIRPC